MLRYTIGTFNYEYLFVIGLVNATIFEQMPRAPEFRLKNITQHMLPVFVSFLAQYHVNTIYLPSWVFYERLISAKTNVKKNSLSINHRRKNSPFSWGGAF